MARKNRAERRKGMAQRPAALAVREVLPVAVTPAVQSPCKWTVKKTVIATAFCAALSIFADLVQVSSVLPLGPEILAQPVQVDRPFNVPFAVINRSWLFDLNRPTFSCKISVIEKDRGDFIDNVITPVQRNDGIEASSRRNYLCDVDNAIPILGTGVKRARIKIRLTYRTLGFGREEIASYSWRNTTRQWYADE